MDAYIYVIEIENIIYPVAAGYTEEELLRRILEAILNGTYNEDKKSRLEIFNAISVEDQFY